jgi:CubicO group peptidase (beta-lactamase class C family)
VRVTQRTRAGPLKSTNVHLDAYGLQDLASRKPVTSDTIFRLASMTKPIVGVAMMILWEQGPWTLDDPVSKHIPEFAGLKVATPGGGGAFGTWFWLDPVNDVVVVGMIQNVNGSSPQVRPLSRQLVYQALVDRKK